MSAVIDSLRYAVRGFCFVFIMLFWVLVYYTVFAFCCLIAKKDDTIEDFKSLDYITEKLTGTLYNYSDIVLFAASKGFKFWKVKQ